MKRRSPARPAWNEHQQLFWTVVLVILLAVSMLYCVGFSSLAVRQFFDNTPQPELTPELIEEEIDATPVVTPALTLPAATPF